MDNPMTRLPVTRFTTPAANMALNILSIITTSCNLEAYAFLLLFQYAKASFVLL